jgi:hypothetical protein
MLTAYNWRAIYDDGTYLDEYDDEAPDGHGFRHIDLPRCVAFALLPNVEGLYQHVVHISPSTGQRLIFFRRHTIAINPQTEQEQTRSCIHVIGWQVTAFDPDGQPRNLASFMFVYDDGSVLLSDNDAV